MATTTTMNNEGHRESGHLSHTDLFTIHYSGTGSPKMFARSLHTTNRTLSRTGAQQIRHNSSLPIPPKIATPKSVSGSGSGGNTSARMDEVVNFYKALPKGNVSLKKGPFTNPGNGKPIVFGIATLMLLGYTMDYQMHLKHHKNRAH